MPRLISALLMVGLMALPHSALSQTGDLPRWSDPLVNDFANVLSPEVESELRALLQAQRDEFDHEVTVLTIDRRGAFRPSPDIASFAKTVFNDWGIGNAERNDGVLLLVAVQDREMRIALGDGYSARYDGIAARITDSIMLPQFRAGRMEKGIVQGTQAIVDRLNLAAPAQPAADWRHDPNAGLSGTEKLTRWASDNPFGAIVIGAIGSVLGFFGIRWGARNRPRKCPECSRVMLRLGEKQEDQYLNHGQLIEEQLASKDYGVWFCTNDEHVTVVGYPTMFSNHSACPKCRFKTRETRSVTERQPTYSATGLTRLYHSCANCDHKSETTRSIPMLEERRSTGFAGSSSGGSFGGGGGFGGGSSGGGGASGGW